MPLTYPTRLAVLLTFLAFVVGSFGPAQAQLNLRIGGGSFQPMPIAVTDFSGDPSLGLLVSSVVTNNLRRSGYFTPVEKAKFPESPGFDAVPGFEKWKAAGVQALITGRVARDASGKLKVEFRLWDVTSGQQMTGQQYGTDPANAGAPATSSRTRSTPRSPVSGRGSTAASPSWTSPAPRRTGASA